MPGQNSTAPSRPASIVLLRVAIALLLGVHGGYRLFTGGYAGFGEYLGSQGLPFGGTLALAITLFELAGPLCLLLGRFVRPVVVVHALILGAGIVMVHAPEGWFVVGAGRNGMEYSVLLLVGLAALFLAEGERREIA